MTCERDHALPSARRRKYAPIIVVGALLRRLVTWSGICMWCFLLLAFAASFVRGVAYRGDTFSLRLTQGDLMVDDYSCSRVGGHYGDSRWSVYAHKRLAGLTWLPFSSKWPEETVYVIPLWLLLVPVSVATFLIYRLRR